MRNLIIILISLISFSIYSQGKLKNRKLYDNFDYMTITYDDFKFNSREELRDIVLEEFIYITLLKYSNTFPEEMYKLSKDKGENLFRLRKMEEDEDNYNRTYYYYELNYVFESYGYNIGTTSFTMCVEYHPHTNFFLVTIRLGEDFTSMAVTPYPEVVFSVDEYRMDLIRNLYSYLRNRFKVVGYQPPYKTSKKK